MENAKRTGAQSVSAAIFVRFLDANKPSILFNLSESEDGYTAEKRGV
jgi:hypothetical protein